MNLIKRLLTVEGITSMVICFIGYKAITITMNTVAWLQATLN